MAYAQVLANIRKKASENKPETKEILAQEAGIDAADITEKTLKGVQTALSGAQAQVDQGADPTASSVSQLKEQATGKPDKDSDEDKSNQQKLMIALAGIVPTLLGGAFGGARGAEIGGKVGVETVGNVAKGIEAEEARRAERGEKTTELALKGRTVSVAERGNVLKEKEIASSKELKAIDAKLAGAKRGQELAGDLRKERMGNPLTKRTQEVTEAFARMQEVSREPSAAGDISLIFNYMKMNDPGSTVREGEFATAQNAAGIPDKLKNLYNRAVNGERLQESQRADFLKQGENLSLAQLGKQESFDSGIRTLATKYNVPEDEVILPFGQGSVQGIREARAPTAPPPKAPSSGGGLPGATSAQAAPIIPTDDQLDSMSDDELRQYLGKKQTEKKR